MKYLITGATGNIGSLVVERLLARGERPRVLARDEGKARALFGDRVDVARADLADPATLRPAFAGVDAVFLVNEGAGLAARDEAAAHTARGERVKRIVKLSSMDVRRDDASSVGAWHAQGQDAIRATGMRHVFVQPAGFMSNALAWAPSIKGGGVVRASTGDGRIAMIHPHDIADVAVAALTDEAYDGASLAITGPEALSYAEMVGAIATAIGRPLTFAPISDGQARERLLEHGLPPPVADALVGLWRAVRQGRIATVTDTVERVLGRGPLAFPAWARENASAFAS
jgi:uncharacterized protein YbjT (DUF2867 family)